jgi:HlyD family secretion protein
MAAQNNNSERNRLLSVIVTLLVAVVLFSGWIKLRGSGVAVRAEKVDRQDISSIISTNGRIEAVNNFERHAAAPATVQRVLVREGDQVRTGQLLLQLDDADARAQAARARAQLRAAEADLHAIESGGTNEEVLTNRTALASSRSA